MNIGCKNAVHYSHTQNGPEIECRTIYFTHIRSDMLMMQWKWRNGFSMLANISIHQLVNVPLATAAHFSLSPVLRAFGSLVIKCYLCCLYHLFAFRSYKVAEEESPPISAKQQCTIWDNTTLPSKMCAPHSKSAAFKRTAFEHSNGCMQFGTEGQCVSVSPDCWEEWA